MFKNMDVVSSIMFARFFFYPRRSNDKNVKSNFNWKNCYRNFNESFISLALKRLTIRHIFIRSKTQEIFLNLIIIETKRKLNFSTFYLKFYVSFFFLSSLLMMMLLEHFLFFIFFIVFNYNAWYGQSVHYRIGIV